MMTLIVTVDGQVTLRKDVLKHFGIAPGGTLKLDLLPDGRAFLEAEQPQRSWRRVYGMLQGKGNGVALTVEDMNDAIGEGAGRAGTAALASE